MALPGISDSCLFFPTLCLLAKGAKATAGSVADSAFQGVVDAFVSGLANVMKALMTFWIQTPAPDLGSGSAVIGTLDALTRPLVAFAAVVGLIVAGVRLAWTARSEQSAQGILRGLLLMTVVSVSGAAIVEVLLTGLDQLGVYILNHGFDGKSVGERLVALGAISEAGDGGGLVFLLAFFGMIASLVQVGIMLVRGAILAVLVGVLPVAAGAAITDAGFTWFKRLCGWIFSFVVYKLVAAIIYAAAFTMIGDAHDLPGIVSGFSLLIVSILALPALLRLIPPSAEAMAGGSGGALAGMVAAGATGAVALAGRGGGSSAPVATAQPGLKRDGGPTGANPTSGGTGSNMPALPVASSGGGAGAGGAASSGAAAAGGPVGAGVAVLSKVHSAASSAANNAAGEGES